ncbi:hypothetical protein Pst134EA_029353 [Puccinia striiformis f. sp. tritici]|uniref:hypothetical protein n=1 Tax=Puccinia striiformis f. sp. tritici TaxID=168172 RepID=UPI0020079555|nr:hypothetical protein Pst134EA_029353 [Puccinia striiformis f. sp. tritici]KAH9447318.1 hypothetical protein Pst134EA_029353 [Puccinia striiformis f. sp. tritici]
MSNSVKLNGKNPKTSASTCCSSQIPPDLSIIHLTSQAYRYHVCQWFDSSDHLIFNPALPRFGCVAFAGEKDASTPFSRKFALKWGQEDSITMEEDVWKSNSTTRTLWNPDNNFSTKANGSTRCDTPFPVHINSIPQPGSKIEVNTVLSVRDPRRVRTDESKTISRLGLGEAVVDPLPLEVLPPLPNSPNHLHPAS